MIWLLIGWILLRGGTSDHTQDAQVATSSKADEAEAQALARAWLVGVSVCTGIAVSCAFVGLSPLRFYWWLLLVIGACGYSALGRIALPIVLLLWLNGWC